MPTTTIGANPYDHTFPDSEFQQMLEQLATETEATILKGFDSGKYSRNSFGIVLLDPTAPLWKPSSECILATVSIGAEGNFFTTNACAKVMEHRDHGVECGIMVYAANHMLTDGDFAYGFSVCLNGTYAGGSGETELQDRFLVTKFVNKFNYEVDAKRAEWREVNPDNRWYCNQNEPSTRYTNALIEFAGKAAALES